LARGKQRADALVVARGITNSLNEARGLIMAGRVVIEEHVVTKPGASVPIDAAVHVRGVVGTYVSRGGRKLAHALHRFGLSVHELDVLDAGASTGGFTDCLLQHGARKVYAVDVGYGQIHSRLAQDSRVVVLERTNVSDLGTATFDRPPDLCVVDLSYLSLVKAVPILEPLLARHADVVALVKPLYEGLPQDAGRSREALHRTLDRLLAALAECSVRRVRGLTCSPIFGGRGAVEFLLWLSAEDRTPIATLEEHSVGFIERALDEAERIDDEGEPTAGDLTKADLQPHEEHSGADAFETSPLPTPSMSRAKPLVVIVMGVCGVGKSEVAKALATTLAASFLEGDDFHPQRNRERMSHGIPLTDEDRGPWLDALGQAVSQVAVARDVVVTCSALRRSYRDRLRAHAPTARFVHLVAPRDVIEARVANRVGHFAPPQLVPSQLATLQPPDPDEDAIECDATRPVDTIVAGLAKSLNRS